MTENKISRYHLGEKLLIGYRDDQTLFWLRNDKDYWTPKKGVLNVLEAGKAWIDEKSETTILDFPIAYESEILQLKNEFIHNSNLLTPYKESDYYVSLIECLPRSPKRPYDPPCEWIDPEYDFPEHLDGYVLDEDTFLRQNNETGELYYIKFTDFSENDFEDDRFGWIKAARKFFRFDSDEDLASELKCWKKESYGNAWIDKKNDVVVLGPVKDQMIEVLDNYYADRIFSYVGLSSEWNKTKFWTDIESGLKSNPFNWKVHYFYLTEKYMG